MIHLENVSTEDLRQILAEVEGKAATERVMAAINWNEEADATQKEIAERYGNTQGWLSQWLQRFERLDDEPFKNIVYDEQRLGRPSELSDEEYAQFVDVLHESPANVGLDARVDCFTCSSVSHRDVRYRVLSSPRPPVAD